MDEILNLLKINRKFRTAIIEKDDNAVDVLYRFVESPECSTCINDLKAYIKENLDSINSIMEEILPKNTTTEAPPPPNIPPTPINVSGEVYEIDADPQQYKELITHAQQQRWVFRGINILERVNESGKKNWVLFFY